MRCLLRTSHVLLVAVALGLGAAACGNISLSTDSAFGMSSAPTPTLNQDDASTPDAGFPFLGPAGGSDGGVNDSPPTVGSALCNYNYAGAHTCQPDDSAQCPGATAADAGSDAGDAATPSACHVVLTSGAVSQACSAAGTGEEGSQCQTGADCAPSYECVNSPGECRHYCCSGDTSCSGTSAPSFCDVQSVAWGELDASAGAGAVQKYSVPVCMPVTHCTLFSTDPSQCPGQACSIVRNDGTAIATQFTTSCVDVGPVLLGGSCETDHCQANLACLGPLGARTCAQLCRVDTPTDCPASMTCTSSAQLFTSSAYGLCQ